MTPPRPHPTTPLDEAEDRGFRAGRVATRHRWVFSIVGGVSILAGGLAIAMPFLASLAAALVLGLALATSGVTGLLTAWHREEGWQLAATFALSILAVVAGALIFLQPVAGILAFTTLVIAYFAASGVLRLWYGVRRMGEGGGWVAALGGLSLVLAILLFLGLPLSAAWVPGVMLGLDLILWGAVMIGFALRAPHAVAPAGGRAADDRGGHEVDA